MDEVVTSERQAGQRFLVNSLMEEAIRSSQLEGATTSRRSREGDAAGPGASHRDRSERMIANNYRALQFMREEMGDDADPGVDPRAAPDRHRGNPRRSRRRPGGCSGPAKKRVAVFDRDDGRRRSTGRRPPSSFPSAWSSSAHFANEGEDGEPVHPSGAQGDPPALLARLRPSIRGRKRPDRADPLLLGDASAAATGWPSTCRSRRSSARRPPSTRAPSWRPRPTSGDTTYFLIHQLRLIERAIDDLHLYLQRKIAEVRDVERLLQRRRRLQPPAARPAHRCGAHTRRRPTRSTATRRAIA